MVDINYECSLAAHCLTRFSVTDEVRSIIVRNNTDLAEKIVVKRNFIHPLYEFPNVYNDIVISQLGRRVNFDNIGFNINSPLCMGNSTETYEGREATIQGFGLTENGKVKSDEKD